MAEFLESINWLEVGGYIVMLIVGALVTYAKTNPKIIKEAAEAEKWLETVKASALTYIDRAENEFKGAGRGEAKFIWVVNTLHGLIPSAIRPYISKDIIEDIVQSAFDVVEDYAKLQFDKIVDEVIPDEEV